MGRYHGVGVGGQVGHPQARGTLPPRKIGPRFGKGKVYGRYDHKDTEQYFVPSFSIRRHLDRSEEERWSGIQKQLRYILGRAYTVTPPVNLTIKSIEQHKFIERMREADVHPSPAEMKNLAYNLRDELIGALYNAPSPLAIPLGRLARFGYKNQALGFELEGWRGYRAHYAMTGEDNQMTAHGALVTENQLALEKIAEAMEDTGFVIDGLARNPHLTIARNGDSIKDHQLRRMQDQIAELAIDHVLVGDPIIELRTEQHAPTEMLHIGHSWRSLAQTA